MSCSKETTKPGPPSPSPSGSSTVHLHIDGSSSGAIEYTQERKHIFQDKDDIVVKRKRLKSGDHGSTICGECKRIDFNGVLDLTADIRTLWREPENGILVANLAARCTGPPTNGCSLCSLFFAARIPSDSAEYELRALSFMGFITCVNFSKCSWDFRARDIPQLCVVPTGIRPKMLAYHIIDHVAAHGSILPTKLEDTMNSNSIFYPRLVSGHVDFTVVKEWTEYCKLHHGRLCATEKALPSGMRLIDCFRPRPAIVPAVGRRRYAALSYVWGQTMQERRETVPPSTNDLPRVLPQTLMDAIQVCKAMDIPFLWVDRYCIHHLDPREAQEQLDQMDTIYESSDITIIALGPDAESGLPGISTIRETQPSVGLHDFHLFSTKPHPHLAIRNSTWSQRGWTFQEAVLSRRRLVFTEHQVYFECCAMNCQ
ncbi:HET-domain-containing protein [Rhizodiscina lignyota]|uniref:HET-domain-containing protein n=1 Tax=Rhizodiscina lignyota TaxID=1504668 RepID=A0A9P4IF53_9PEZI|nr:HET-domain-containing protein [Rhizodiscina lignyota]